MQWKNGREYDPGTEFSQAQLIEIRPRHLVRYMCLLAYGVEVPGDDHRPNLRRSSGLEFVKKAISFFMPNRNFQWSVESETGNPIMSVAVKDLIKQAHEERGSAQKR